VFKSIVLKNTLYQFISRFFVVLISILTTYFLTRNFGVNIFGQYVFITSFALLFSGLSDLGSNILAVRESSFEKDQISKIFSDVFSFRIMFSLILIFVYILLVLILPQFKGIEVPSLIACLIIPFSVIKTSSQSVLQSKQRFDKSSILEFYSAFLFLLFSFYFVITKHYFLQNIVLVWIFSSFVTSIISWLNIKKYV
jgi:O-antigen/teichoic acid export membrane protein